MFWSKSIFSKAWCKRHKILVLCVIDKQLEIWQCLRSFLTDVGTFSGSKLWLEYEIKLIWVWNIQRGHNRQKSTFKMEYISIHQDCWAEQKSETAFGGTYLSAAQAKIGIKMMCYFCKNMWIFHPFKMCDDGIVITWKGADFLLHCLCVCRAFWPMN